MGEAPTLPEEMNEEKKQAVTAILQFAADSLPPPLPNVEAGEFKGSSRRSNQLMISENVQLPDGPRVRHYRPTDIKDETLPLVLFCHGGGWFAGNLDTEDRTCRIVCSEIRAWIVSVDYRCDFDVPLKVMVDDCCGAFEWARSNASTYGADPTASVVWGGSAGGALAVAAVHRLVQAGKKPSGLVAMNPITCHPDATPAKYKHLNTSYIDNAGPLPFVSGRDTLELYRHRQIEPPNTDTKIFPAAGGAEAVAGFPRTYIITSDNDASRDDGTILEAALEDAGVPVRRDNIMGLAHYYWSFDLPKANADFWSKLCSGLEWTLERK